MAKGYRPVDRDTVFLLPPDMREWLPADHPVWLIIDVVQRLDTRPVHAGRKTGGVGRAGFHPDMLLTLLIWSWAQGQRSSRRIERLCSEDIAYRVICVGDVPDHVTISRFRKGLDTAVQDLFAQVLILCAELGMGRLGVVALDGVKIASNASLSANRSASSITKLAAAELPGLGAAELAAQAAAEHAASDAADDRLFSPGDRGDQVPPGLTTDTDPQTRAARLQTALEQVRALKDKADRQPGRVSDQRVADAEQQLRQARDVQQGKVDAYEARVTATGRRPVGGPPTPVEERSSVVRAAQKLANLEARAATQEPVKVIVNLTDPFSGRQPLRGGGWVQGYNCQAVTSSDGLIIAVSVSANPVDAPTFETMMGAAVAAASLINAHQPGNTTDRPADPAGIGTLLADAGYLSNHNLTCPGPDRLIAVGRHRDLETAAINTPAVGPPPDNTPPIPAMTHRLRTPEGIALYRQRSHIAETPFGHMKHNNGFRRFTGRGPKRALTEWTLNALVYNLSKAINTGRLNTT